MACVGRKQRPLRRDPLPVALGPYIPTVIPYKQTLADPRYDYEAKCQKDRLPSIIFGKFHLRVAVVVQPLGMEAVDSFTANGDRDMG